MYHRAQPHPDARSSERATEWAENTIQYEDNNGFGHIVLGHLQLFEGRHDEALANCRIATALLYPPIVSNTCRARR